jgi:UDP-N-acetylglucosamine diphosphorylase / glucose-1-phosphate thymidylyltransferase / UDP-N-acetylgalactosamine diphosphorylase / glucosamine-1-phosphate N-acetyltransferase / galactosamine-1-phosphate N-acetyltransferase
MKELVALVLAGGNGSRFWPLTQDKILFPFLNQPFITHSIGDCIPDSVSSLVIIASPRNKEQLEKMTFSRPHQVVIQNEPLGMADAILVAKDQIAGKRLLILIADDLFESYLPEELVTFAEKGIAFAVLPGWKTKAYFPGGYLRLNGDRIVGIEEKPGPGCEPSQFVNIACHYIADSDVLLEQLRKTESKSDDIYERALSNLMHDHEFLMMPYEGLFTSLKYPWHVLSVMDTLLKSVSAGQGVGVVIKNNVTIEGSVYLGDNVKVMENTKIVGPCFIGNNTIIGNNNVIRHSMIGSHCVTGFNTDITRSYIGNECWFHSNYIGDSVLENNISMGSGTVLANLRLDEQDIHSIIKEKKVNAGRNKLGSIIGSNVRIGVNASIMPGVKIGSGSFVGAGLTVALDIPNNSFVRGKTELIIENNSKQITNDREEFKKKI